VSEGKLQTAVLGIDSAGQLLSQAAPATGDFHIVAVADKDTNLAQKLQTNPPAKH
jgi:hypothetical protein